MSKIDEYKKERRQILDDINSGRIKGGTPEYAKAAARKRELSALTQNPESAKAEPEKPGKDKQG